VADRVHRKISRSQARADLMRIYAAAVSAVDPRRIVARAIGSGSAALPEAKEMIERARRVSVLAVGKAAIGMGAEALSICGEKVETSLAIAPPPIMGSAAPTGLRIIQGAHPLPDESSLKAGEAVLKFVASIEPGALLLFLLIGGASALIAAPVGSVTLADKVMVTSALMNAGASIHELNTVRKHLSAIKGGGLARAVPEGVRVLTLILSDVPGNALATIGSGPTVGDPSTYSDAIAVLKRRKVWGRAPEAVRDHLERGAAGEIEETPKPDDSALERVRNIIIADNATAVDGARECATLLGYNVVEMRDLSGKADEAGRRIATSIGAIAGPPTCFVAGGETAVDVVAGGKGGRSQQAALAMALEIAEFKGRSITALFAGTDGIDGPTDAAGAIVDCDTVRRAAEAGWDAADVLARTDAYPLFKALGDLVITGPSGTNVADVFIGLVDY
jgi:glycerate 2-kinase